MQDIELLTLDEIAQRLGIGYGKLRGFADQPGVKEFVGAIDVPDAKGVRYPLEAEAKFRFIMEEQKAGRVQPKTITAYLQSVSTEAGNVLMRQSSSAAIVPLQQQDIAESAAALREIVVLLQQRIEPPDDRWLNEEQAFALLQCSPRRRVRQIVPGVWSYLEIQEYMRKRREGKG